MRHARAAFVAVLGLLPAWAANLAAAQDLRPLALRQDLLGWEGVGRVAMPRAAYFTAS